MWSWIAANAATLRDLAAALGIVTAVITLGINVWRSRVERLNAREIGAKRIYAEVLRLCFDNPQFAEPRPADRQQEAFMARFVWFLSNILNAFDEILLSTSDPMWRRTARSTLAFHAEELSAAAFQANELKTYCDELQGIVSEVIADRRSDAAS